VTAEHERLLVGGLLKGSQAGTTIELTVTVTLCLSKMLTGSRREESWKQTVSFQISYANVEENKIHTNMLSVLDRALHLGLVIRTRKRLLLSNQSWIFTKNGVEELCKLVGDEWHMIRLSTNLGPIMLGLEHDRRVSKLLDQAVLSLDR
jgi:hypothetical protein